MAFYRTLAVLGGDGRQPALCEYLVRRGHTVRVFGLPQEKIAAPVEVCADWRDTLTGADAVILPLPASPDGRHVHMPLGGEGELPLLKELFCQTPSGTPILGGRFSPAVKRLAEETGALAVDYFESEGLQQKNALPTAEGAVSVLMREIPRTVSGLSVAVTGFGRVAKALIRLLLAMGAHVTVGARRTDDLLAARAQGCRTVQLTGVDSLRKLANGQTVIFNTVPHWLFSDEVLAGMSTDTVIIDLASAPGGVDSEAAARRGIRVIFALSLPGKYAPYTAGEIIAETVLSYLEEGIL